MSKQFLFSLFSFYTILLDAGVINQNFLLFIATGRAVCVIFDTFERHMSTHFIIVNAHF